jgi:A/G-specific adenine glycosylase
MFATDFLNQFREHGLDPELIKQFQAVIWGNYRNMHRRFPWRETKDPYHIFVSEFMLQQTQAERVVEKYNQFLSRFPDFKSLAQAPLDQVIILWQGLGYNRRAVWMKQAAERVFNEYIGILPKDPAVLETFKGIGHATAREMTIFSYNIREAFIETNIRRVYIYFFFANKQSVEDKEILSLVDRTIDDKNPREWFYALMDYGVMLKKKFPKENPNLKSAQYSKQSKFKGSNRQLRGQILQLVIQNPGIELQNIILKLSNETSNWPEQSIRENIEKMEHEGIFKRTNNMLFISK